MGNSRQSSVVSRQSSERSPFDFPGTICDVPIHILLTFNPKNARQSELQ